MKHSNFRLFAIIAAVLFGSLPSLFAQEGITWEKDINTALAKARDADRLVFIHFYGPNCPPCQLMDAEVFPNRQVIADMNRFFVPVKVDSSLNPQLVKQFDVKAIPTDIVLKSDGNFVHRRQGGISAERFDVYLNYIYDEARPKNVALQAATAPVAQPEPPQAMIPVAPPATNPTVYVPPVLQQPHGGPPTANPWDVAAVSPPAVDPRTLVAPPASPPIPIAERPNPVRPDAVRPDTPSVAVSEVTPFIDGTTGLTVEIPLALDGFCPVTLGSQERWQSGNPIFYAMYRGQIFRCVNEEALEAFSKDPAKYAPVAMGEDIVQMVNRNKKIAGQRKFGAWFQDRVYLFSSQESLDAFAAKPEFFAEIALKYETALRTRFDAIQR